MVFQLFFYVFHTIAKVNLGLYLEGLGRLSGSTWAQLGRSWGQLGGNLGALGANLGATWAASGPSWALLGPTWTHFGLHGPSKASLGLLLEALGRVLEAQRSCLGGPKRSQQLNSEAKIPPRSQFWRPQMPSWRRVAFPDSSTWRNQAVEEISS